jgi:hypothetical protein
MLSFPAFPGFGTCVSARTPNVIPQQAAVAGKDRPCAALLRRGQRAKMCTKNEGTRSPDNALIITRGDRGERERENKKKRPPSRKALFSSHFAVCHELGQF